MEWSQLVKETESASPYFGEVLDTGFRITQAVVILFTPDEETRLKEELRVGDEIENEKDLSGQARPNVLFEAGMAFGLHPNRSRIIEFGELRGLTDLLGRHVIRFRNNPEKIKEIIQRLETAGCIVDTSGNDWLREDRFKDII